MSATPAAVTTTLSSPRRSLRNCLDDTRLACASHACDDAVELQIMLASDAPT
jgi:hypothetical protein